MRVAYLILAHADPKMLALLVKTVAAPNSAVFVHIDQKSDIDSFSDIKENVEYIESRIPIYWGHSSIASASIKLLEHAHKIGGFDYYHLMSGADYPIKPMSEFYDFLKINNRKSYIYSKSCEISPEGKKRVSSPYIIEERTTYSVMLQKAVFFFYRSLSIRRPAPKDVNFLIGENWFTIHKSVVPGLLAMWHRPDMKKFFSKTYLAEEIFFPTGINAVGGDGEVVNHSLKATKWSGEPHPKTLELGDMADILGTDAFFARKFSSMQSRELLRRLARDVHAIDCDF